MIGAPSNMLLEIRRPTQRAVCFRFNACRWHLNRLLGDFGTPPFVMSVYRSPDMRAKQRGCLTLASDAAKTRTLLT